MGHFCSGFYFKGSGRMRMEAGDGEALMEVRWFDVIDNAGCIEEIVICGVLGEDMASFSPDVIEFRDARMIDGT